MPAWCSAAMRAASGSPKWKLTTDGRSASNTSSMASSATKLVYISRSVAGGCAPNSAKAGARYSIQRAWRAASAVSGAWQNRFTPNGRAVSARVWAMAWRAPSALVAPRPSEPRPPALDTAAARAGVLVPAMGAWMIGVVRPRRDIKVEAAGLEVGMASPGWWNLQATVLECEPAAKRVRRRVVGIETTAQFTPWGADGWQARGTRRRSFFLRDVRARGAGRRQRCARIFTSLPNGSRT